MTAPRWLVLAVLALIVALTVGVTLAVERDDPPAGSVKGSDTVALVALIVTPLATVAVALVAAVTARTRLETQLGEERKRLNDQLKAESARERQRLDHERRLHDLDGLRSLIDEASAAMFEMVPMVVEARDILRNANGPLSVDEVKTLTETVRPIQEALVRYTQLESRLLVHFDTESELYGSFRKFGGAIEAEVAAFLTDEPAEKRLKTGIEAGAGSGEHAQRFRAAAREAVGFVVPRASG